METVSSDAIRYSEEDRFLRIFDCKTGVTPAHIEQLMIYAALFCLASTVKPNDIEMELRIYQNDEVVIHHPDPEDILRIMGKIISLDKLLKKVDEEV